MYNGNQKPIISNQNIGGYQYKSLSRTQNT
jgi:hypothetical protein